MPVKRYFDGTSLTEIELPDQPLPVYSRSASVHDLISPQNPTGVDPNILPVDAAGVPDLVPTEGALPTRTQFAPPPPGDGQGPGVGQPSGQPVHNVWDSVPRKNDDKVVETVQSGDIGSALPEEQRDAPRSGYDPVADASNPATAGDVEPTEAMTKAQLGEYIARNGGTPPASNENKDAFLAEAKRVYDDRNSLA